jgi:hypothetical protein
MTQDELRVAATLQPPRATVSVVFDLPLDFKVRPQRPGISIIHGV